MTQSHSWQLIARPKAQPQISDFELTERTLPELDQGQMLVRNLYLSVDPYMRGRMNDTKSYIAPFGLGEPMTGGALGRVVASRSTQWKEGDLIEHFYGWRDTAVLKENEGRKVQDLPGIPLSARLGALGMPGLAAYVGLLQVGHLQPGDRVFVSGAAGAVGSLVGQIARIKGCFVLGSCGSEAKARLLIERFGFDGALNYRQAPIAEQLKPFAADGFDVYFDNVGGDHLEAAIDLMRKKGRIVLCGAISQYNQEVKTPGPNNLIIVMPSSMFSKTTATGVRVPRNTQAPLTLPGMLSGLALVSGQRDHASAGSGLRLRRRRRGGWMDERWPVAAGATRPGRAREDRGGRRDVRPPDVRHGDGPRRSGGTDEPGHEERVRRRPAVRVFVPAATLHAVRGVGREVEARPLPSWRRWCDSCHW